MNFTLSDSDLSAIARATVVELQRFGALAGRLPTERLGFPEPEAARLIGVRQHVLRDARLRGEINGRRIGRSVIYGRESLLRWLEAAE